MTDFTDKIAQVIRTTDGNHDMGAGALAEAIVAALPDMVPDLVWEYSTYKKHEGCIVFAKTNLGTYFIGYDNDDYTGFYLEFVTLGDATWFGTVTVKTVHLADHHHDDDLSDLKSAANAHYRAQAVKPFGIKPEATS